MTSRRRASELERAVYDATLTELKTAGYHRFTMEKVAARAGCGKASLYRRWPGKRDLILAALKSLVPLMPTGQRLGSSRQNLFATLSSLAEVLVGNTPYPESIVIVGLFHDAEIRSLYVDSVLARSTAVLENIILAGICSGEVDPASVTALAVQTGPALILQHALLVRTVPTPFEIEQIIDTMLGRPGDQPTAAVNPCASR